MLCGQRVRPPWLLLLLTLVCNSSFPKKKKKNEFAHSHLWSPSRPPYFTGIFWRPRLRAADGASLGPDRALFCVPQRAGQPPCEAVELAQAAREAWQCHSMAQHACGRLSHAQERPPPLGMPPCSPAQRLGNLHFALARWRPSRGLLRLRICTLLGRLSVIDFWNSFRELAGG